MIIFNKLIDKLGFKDCREYNLGLWQCPSFLFIMMGVVNIMSMLTTYYIVQKYDSPELVVISVFAISVFIFSLGFSIIQGIQQMVAMNKLRGEFVSIASHQLRAPLSGMRWACDILGDPRNGELNEKQKEYLNDVQSNITRMVRLVGDLLDVSRIDAGRMTMTLQEVDLFCVAKDVSKELHSFALANNTELVLKFKGKSAKVKTDPMRIKMVLENFIDNAIKYIGDKKKGKVIINIESGRDIVYCEVRDNGVGISKEDQKKIFDKFFRGREVTRKQTIGTGLGLYIAKAAIENSGGQIGFSSVAKKGSKFWFSLPVSK
jgi:signal transduction histidine kinase